MEICLGGNWVCAQDRLEKWKDVWFGIRLEYVVGWVCGGSMHEVLGVMSGQEVPDRGVTAPPRL